VVKYCLDARSATNHFPGIGRYISNLARALNEQLEPDEKLILLSDPSRPSTWTLPASQENVKNIETNVSPFSLQQQWRIPKILKEQGADLYHSPYYLMPYFSRLPTVVTIHDLIPQLFPEYFSSKTRILSSWLKQVAMKRADMIVTDSEATQLDVLQRYGYPPRKVTAVPLAADGRFQPQSEAEIRRIKQTYRLPDVYLLYLGINKPHKNLPLLVQAYSNIATRHESAPPLIIAGVWDNRYPEAKHLAAQSPVNNKFHFLGPIPHDDLAALYTGALFFIFPSLYEGFGLPVIEAMACGTAVICAKSSSLIEVTADAALTFNPHQPAELMAQIELFLDRPALIKEYEGRGLQQAQTFSWQKTAAATLDCYRLLL